MSFSVSVTMGKAVVLSVGGKVERAPRDTHVAARQASRLEAALTDPAPHRAAADAEQSGRVTGAHVVRRHAPSNGVAVAVAHGCSSVLIVERYRTLEEWKSSPAPPHH